MSISWWIPPLNRKIFKFLGALFRSGHPISYLWQPLQKHGYGFGSVLEYGYGYGLWLSISLNGIDSYLFSLWVGYGYIKRKVRFIWLDSIGKFLVLILVWLWLSISMDGIDYCSLWNRCRLLVFIFFPLVSLGLFFSC